MRLVKIAEVKDLENKEAIPSIRGTLTRVYEYKTGEGQYGTYSFQNGEIRDDSGESKIVFSNHPDIKSFLNREIFIKSYSGDKGLSGIMADDNKYKDKMTRQIKVTATADISLVDASSKAAEGSRTRPDNETVSGQPNARKTASQWSQAARMALDTVHAVKLAHDMEYKDTPMKPEQFQALVSGLIIYFDRRGVIETFEVSEKLEKPVAPESGWKEDEDIPF